MLPITDIMNDDWAYHVQNCVLHTLFQTVVHCLSFSVYTYQMYTYQIKTQVMLLFVESYAIVNLLVVKIPQASIFFISL